MSQLGVALQKRDSGREVGRYALPVHTHERLMAEAHSCGVLSGDLPNNGLPLEDSRVALVGVAGASPALEVGIQAGDARYRKSYRRESISNDAQVLVSRLCQSGAIAPGNYEYLPVALPPERPAAGGLKVTPFARRLPILPTLSLREAGIALPVCPHPAVFLPRHLAERMLAQAQATPDIEVGALLLVSPFFISEEVPHRLGIFVGQAVELKEGTVGEAMRLRISPAALAAVPVDETRGQFRGGLAHSHPLGGDRDPEFPGLALFLSHDDLAFATAFFWRPFQIQLVIDVRETDPELALGAFCWVEGRLVRVCFRIVQEQPETWAGTP